MSLKTIVTFVVSGNQTSFSFSFDYLKADFVKVYVNDLQVYNYIITNRQIDFDEAPVGTLRIQRVTPTDQIIEWTAGAVLRSKDMTTSQVQQMHILEEASDALKENSMVTDDNTGQWQSRGLRVTNVADPVDAQDVTTKGYIESVKVGFISVMTTTKDACISALNTTKDSTLASLISLRDEALTIIANLRDSSLSAIGTLGDSALNAIESAKSTALTAIGNLQTSATNALTTLRDNSVSAMNIIKAEVDALKVTATEQAGISTTKAGVATTEANRAKTEADRAYNNAQSIDVSNFYSKTEVDGKIPTSLPANGGNADTVDNLHVHSPLSVIGPDWSSIPRIGSTGVLEIGKYIDFHNSANDTADYAARIHSEGSTLRVSGLPILLESGFSAAATGWFKMSNGLILQWGETGNYTLNGFSYGLGNQLQFAVGFPIRFPSACVMVRPTFVYLSGGFEDGRTMVNTGTRAENQDNFVLIARNWQDNGTTATVKFRWFALGW